MTNQRCLCDISYMCVEHKQRAQPVQKPNRQSLLIRIVEYLRVKFFPKVEYYKIFDRDDVGYFESTPEQLERLRKRYPLWRLEVVATHYENGAVDRKGFGGSGSYHMSTPWRF